MFMSRVGGLTIAITDVPRNWVSFHIFGILLGVFLHIFGTFWVSFFTFLVYFRVSFHIFSIFIRIENIDIYYVHP